MEKDLRYQSLKALIDTRNIKHFREIFNYIPKSILRRDLRINNTRITRLMDHPEQFTLDELFTIANLIGTEERTIFELIYQEYLFNQSKAKTKK